MALHPPQHWRISEKPRACGILSSIVDFHSNSLCETRRLWYPLTLINAFTIRWISELLQISWLPQFDNERKRYLIRKLRSGKSSDKKHDQIRSILILNSVLQQYVLCDTHCSHDILRNVSFPFEAFRLFFQARTLNIYSIILSELVIENLKIFGLYSNIVCCPIYVCWSFYVEISKHVWRSWHRTVRKMNFDYWECWMKSFKGQMRSLVIGISLCTLFAIH